jgi:uncharacterized protein (TIGR04562 family)
MEMDTGNNLLGQELHHEIFGSALDRDQMTPYLLHKADNYDIACRQATKMLGNRGFDTLGGTELIPTEFVRAYKYIEKTYTYCFTFLFPSLKEHLGKLTGLKSGNFDLYKECLEAIETVEALMTNDDFKDIVIQDPRHLLLLASSRKYPLVFYGYENKDMDIPTAWQHTACSMLKVAYLIKSIEEDSQDINDYSQLGLFLEMDGQNLADLYNYHWERPGSLPKTEPAQRAFVKISTFFHKLKESLAEDTERGCLIFNSGDGVEVEIAKIVSRLKSPSSMFTKLGKSVEGEAHNIRDILAITFIIRNREDTLKLFHALQKQGVILQENTISQSITQTLFDSPSEMVEAVRNLIITLSKHEGKTVEPDIKELTEYAEKFYNALSINAAKNPHSSLGQRKFQCKLNFSIPIHRNDETNRIMVPGTEEHLKRKDIHKKTEQHTLAVELRISDEESWERSEQKGDSHHDAYKFRQLVTVMNRVFKNSFSLPEEKFGELREDQKKLFP